MLLLPLTGLQEKKIKNNSNYQYRNINENNNTNIINDTTTTIIIIISSSIILKIIKKICALTQE